MGQRTAILLKKNYGNNRSTITLIHHQWGIGKVMPSLLLQEVLKSVYPLDRSLEYIRTDKNNKKLPIDYFYTFEPLNNPNNNYITNKEVETDNPEEDIWKREVRVKYGNQTDNNNGLMLVEVTQLYNGNSPATYGNMFDVKIGFALGDEEVCMSHPHLKYCIDVEPCFDRLVSMEEFAQRTFGHNDEVRAYTKKYIKAVRDVMTVANVEEVYDKGGEKKRDAREKHIYNCIDALTKDLSEGQEIEVPEEFRTTYSLYK